MDAAGPLLCAGITTYSPMRHFGMVRPAQQHDVLRLTWCGQLRLPSQMEFQHSDRDDHAPGLPPQDKPGQKIGVVGLGGLGHMAVKFGKAFGCEVTVISTSPNKKEEALERLGADHFLVFKDEEEMAKQAGTLAGIIDTVSGAGGWRRLRPPHESCLRCWRREHGQHHDLANQQQKTSSACSPARPQPPAAPAGH